VFHEVMADDPFEAIVAAHHPEIHRYLRRVAPRASDADDLSQETFIRAYRAWRSLPADANVRAWLFAIATNLCRNHHRAEGRRSRAYATVRARPDAAGDGPEGEAVGREARVLIERIVDGLPMKQRMAFIMRKAHDLDYDGIGRSLACSAESARAHVFQALRKIRRALDGHALGPMEESR
jgi:RNA polymerase sigma-70 factor, ECF subfamily